MKENKFANSIETVLLGMLLSIIAFIVLGYSDGLFHDRNEIRWLPTINDAEFVRTQTGMVKLAGIPEVYGEIKIPQYDKNLLYVKRVYQEKDGEEWKDVRFDEAWSRFTLLGIEVWPENLYHKYFNLEEKYVKEEGDTRQVFYGVDADESLIVVGEINDKLIQGGDTFAISNKDNTTLEIQLRSEIHEQWWFYKLISAFLLAIGFAAFFLPIIAFLELLPQLGAVAVFIIIGVSILTAVLFVTVQTLVFAFWYLIFLVLFAMVYLFIRINTKKKKKPIELIPK